MMRKYYPEILMALILALAVSIVCAPVPEADVAELTPVLASMEAPVSQPAPFDGEYVLRLRREGQFSELSLREYLIGVVMSEMRMSFDDAALQAQAIASRTFALRCGKHEDADICADSGCCQAWRDSEALSERFGGDYEAFYRKAEAAVDATDGLVLKYEGKLIDATFFACSGGMTEDAVAVWGTEIPYLRSVESPGEEIADCYHSSVTYSSQAFAERVLAFAPEAVLSGDPAHWLGEVHRTPGDGVMEAELGNVVLSGVELRRIFELKSTRFTIQYDDSGFIFDVYGYGHRVGMSQYGAQAMAEAGADAKTILKTYYTGVDVVPMQL